MGLTPLRIVLRYSAAIVCCLLGIGESSGQSLGI